MTRTLLSFGFLSAAAAMLTPVTAFAQTEAQIIQVETAPPGAPVAQPMAPPPPPAAPAPMYVDQFGQPLGAPPPGMMFVDQYGQPIAQPSQPVAPRRPRVRQPAHLRGTIGVSAHYLSFTDSEYRQAAGLWGFGGFQSATAYAIDGGIHVLPFLMIGARGGYVSAGGGAAAFDGAQLQLQMVDFGLIVRAGYPLALRGGWMFFPGVQLEAGGANATTSLRGESQSALIPRLGANILMMFATPHVGLSLRVGYSSAHWSDAGGRGVDLELGGFSAGLGAEVRL